MLALPLAAACGGGDDDGNGGAEATPSPTLQITARNLQFDKDTLVAPAESGVTLTFANEDNGVPHNVAIYESRGGAPIYVGETFPGNETRDYEFDAPAAGEYFFRCDVHPDSMTGTFAVR